MAHTPGPWKYGSSAPINRTVADVGYWLVYAEIAVDDENDEADARLVAASPALLAACKALEKAGVLTEYLGDESEAIEAKRQTRAAIAKAEGNIPDEN